MRDLQGLMKQAQEMQKKMADNQAEIERLTIEGVSGGGMVRVTLKGNGDMASLTLDPSLLKPEEAEMVEDLILAAHNDAKKKADEIKAKSMQNLLPAGMKLPF
jgi:nucleoid-associated protein EbfC